MKRTLNPLILNKNLNLFPDCLDNRYSYANNPITRRICLSSKQSHRLRTFRVNVCEIFIQRNQKRNLKIEIRFLPFALLNFLDQEKKKNSCSIHDRSHNRHKKMAERSPSEGNSQFARGVASFAEKTRREGGRERRGGGGGTNCERASFTRSVKRP